MNHVFRTIALAGLFTCFLLAGGTGPAPASDGTAANQESTRGEAARWSDRLEALDPSRPMMYFELGEEVEDAATTPEERTLARQLFGLAGILDRESLGRSAALAIAGLESRGVARERLRAAAELLAPVGTVDIGTARRTTTTREGRLHFCKALAALRRGDGSRARRHLDKADAEVVLEQLGPRLSGGVARFRRDIETYQGRLRPDLDPAEIQGHLVAELLALSGGRPAWSVSLVSTDASPLLVVDLERLDRLFGVDPARPYWRDGRWLGPRELQR